ncbi:hypothetical protein KUTeg_009683 [Tegillarca granosa]|uniref:Uncharacterized protein n=1 Tax=Tegillarca granosa TaxID=220873 RepID=A0ABQ9F7Q3_TEGGR|nr:hypothetical protein KUTeg_009683 [Tegillarca granosa]
MVHFVALHPWVTRDGACPLPTEEENCELVVLTDEDIKNVVKHVPKLDTLVCVIYKCHIYLLRVFYATNHLKIRTETEITLKKNFRDQGDLILLQMHSINSLKGK